MLIPGTRAVCRTRSIAAGASVVVLLALAGCGTKPGASGVAAGGQPTATSSSMAMSASGFDSVISPADAQAFGQVASDAAVRATALAVAASNADPEPSEIKWIVTTEGQMAKVTDTALQPNVSSSTAAPPPTGEILP